MATPKLFLSGRTKTSGKSGILGNENPVAIHDFIATYLAAEPFYKGDYNAATNTPLLDATPIVTKKGDMYNVSVAGTFFTTPVVIGDLLIAKQVAATAEAHWLIISGVGSIETLAQTLAAGNQTGATDIVITSNQKISASSGAASLDLWANGVDHQFSLTTDVPGGYAEGWVYGTPTVVQMGFSTTFYTEINNTAGYIKGVTSAAFIAPNQIGIADAASIGSVIGVTLEVADSNGAPVSTASANGMALFLNSGKGATTSTYDMGINNAVLLGGQGLTARLNDTPVCNQLSLQPISSAFDCLLKPGTLTADIEIDFPLVSGRALVQRVVTISSTPHTAVDGETLMVDTTTAGGPVTINLPTSQTNMRITVKNIAGANAITLNAGADSIEGGGTLALLATVGNFVTIVAEGANWWVVAERNV